MHTKRFGAKSFVLLILGIVFTSDAVAARKDFKGLFGSYRREKFTENEARDTDFGMDLKLSTLLPMTPVVNSIQTDGGASQPLNYSSFFNYEASFFFTLNYNWEISANIGYYTYETRKQNVGSDPSLPLFHQFEMDAIPMLLGVRYRFSTSDIVPYIGAAGGMAYVRRKGFFDYDTVRFNEVYNTVITAQAMAGVDFYFASRAGIRLEAGLNYFQLPQYTYDTGGSITNHPVIVYQSNPFSVRYASGVFFLF